MKKRKGMGRLAAAALSLSLIWSGIPGLAGETEERREPAGWEADGQLLPERWSSAEVRGKPVTKNQGEYETCWALTAVSALETALLPEKEMEFSADHMSLNNGFAIGQEEGGDYSMIMAYLSGWQGPVTEAEDPYGDGYSPGRLAPAVHVQEIVMLQEPEPEEWKQAVYRYGAVQTSLYMNRGVTGAEEGYYKEETSAYFYPEKQTPDHDVLILGWDDSYPKENFAREPEEDGAFICLNSWGEDFGENGIFYVSYEDANMADTGLVYTRVEDTDNYDAVYQTDDCGWRGEQGYADAACWFANVYTSASAERLAAVGFYSTGRDTSYEIYLVHDFESEASFGNMEFLQAGSLEYAGYYTVDLEEERLLEEGERFAVAVRITTPGADNPVAVEFQADAYTQNVTLAGKEGYISRYGEVWDQTEETYGTNVCLKAYTRR